jgi:hypothetical protein
MLARFAGFSRIEYGGGRRKQMSDDRIQIRPVARAKARTRPVTIERTTKKYKALQAIGLLIALAFSPLIVYGVITENIPVAGISCVAFAGGAVICLLGATLAWWYHG